MVYISLNFSFFPLNFPPFLGIDHLKNVSMRYRYPKVLGYRVLGIDIDPALMRKGFLYIFFIHTDFFPKTLIFLVIYTDFVLDHSGRSGVAPLGPPQGRCSLTPPGPMPFTSLDLTLNHSVARQIQTVQSHRFLLLFDRANLSEQKTF